MRHVRRNDEVRERGAALILGAVMAVVALMAAALSVDIGRLALEKRDDQRTADLAALDAVRGLAEEGVTDQQALVESLATASALRNGFDPTAAGNSIAVERGVLDPLTCSFAPIPPAVPLPVSDLGAVRVTVGSEVPFFFAFGTRGQRATAIASLLQGGGLCSGGPGTPGTTTPPGEGYRPVGSIAIGSTLATVRATPDTELPPIATTLTERAAAVVARSKLLDALVGDMLTGGSAASVGIDAVGYKGLALASVTIEELGRELGFDMTAASVEEVLDAEFEASQLIEATAFALDRKAGTAGYDATVYVPARDRALHVARVRKDRERTVSTSRTRLRDYLDFTGTLSPGSGRSLANASMSAMDMIRATAFLVDGDHLASADLPVAPGGTIPGTDITIPGMTGARLTVGLIESPRVGGPGPAAQDGSGAWMTHARTAQLRQLLEVWVDVTVPFPDGTTKTVSMQVPVTLEGGSGDAFLTAGACNTTPHTASILARTRAAVARLATAAGQDLVDPSLPALPDTVPVLIDTSGLRVTSAGVEAVMDGASNTFAYAVNPSDAAALPQTQRLDGAPITVPTVTTRNLTVSFADLSPPPLPGLPDPVAPIVAQVQQIVADRVNQVTSIVQERVVDRLFGALGLSYGAAGADVSLLSLPCDVTFTPGTTSPGTPPTPSTTTPGSLGRHPKLVG